MAIREVGRSSIFSDQRISIEQFAGLMWNPGISELSCRIEGHKAQVNLVKRMVLDDYVIVECGDYVKNPIDWAIYPEKGLIPQLYEQRRHLMQGWHLAKYPGAAAFLDADFVPTSSGEPAKWMIRDWQAQYRLFLFSDPQDAPKEALRIIFDHLLDTISPTEAATLIYKDRPINETEYVPMMVKLGNNKGWRVRDIRYLNETISLFMLDQAVFPVSEASTAHALASDETICRRCLDSMNRLGGPASLLESGVEDLYRPYSRDQLDHSSEDWLFGDARWRYYHVPGNKAHFRTPDGRTLCRHAEYKNGRSLAKRGQDAAYFYGRLV